ncbi:MAG: ABC transporter permease subunit [Candidatus Eremiobacteraeota bacterium]|nr:ABC transporter permease subunit [Candidatus Eremiobacteraeota bacterium]
MNAVFKKELRSYFSSPLAYILMAIFLCILGFLFINLLSYFSKLSVSALRSPMYMDRVNASDSVLRPLFDNFAFLFLIVIPILTMKSFAEEKRLGSIELLFTYPLTEFQLIMGKFLAVFIVGGIMVGLTILFPVILNIFVPQMEWGIVLSGYIGVFLLLCAFLSLGLWASSLCDNLVIAYMVAFGGSLLFWVLGWLKHLYSGTLMEFLGNLGFIEHLQNFSKGVIDTADIVFFILFSVFFLFCTYLSLESRKWKG